MIMRLVFLILTILCFPLSAFAAKINIEYTGHISSVEGEDLGYQIGNLISGTVVIDLSKIEGRVLDDPDLLWVYATASSGLLTSSNYTGAYTADLPDFVQIYDHTPYLSNNYEGFTANEILSVNGAIMDGFRIHFFHNSDWITGLSAKSIHFESDDPIVLKDGGGYFGRWYLDPWITLGTTQFQLDSIKIHSTNVPDPSGLMLALIGLLGLALKRK